VHTVKKIDRFSLFSVSRVLPVISCILSIRGPVVLLSLAVLGLTPVKADASLPFWTGDQELTSIAGAPGGGFWVQEDNLLGDPQGGTLAKEGAPGFENVSKRGSIAAIPGRNGYWVVTDDGQIFARGDAPSLCGGELSHCSAFPEYPKREEFIVGAAATPSDLGLWALGRDGKVWIAGDAQTFGDVQNDPQIPTGMVATPSGNGYYIVMEDGYVFSFGDAVFYGSTGGNPPVGNSMTGIALSVGDDGKVNGYWLVAGDGGVLSFGNAPVWKSSDGDYSAIPVSSIVSFPAPVPNGIPQRTRGYARVDVNGQISATYGASWLPSAK
jgi:hypothetical protein